MHIYNIFIKVGRVTRRNKTKCSFEHFVRVCACVLHVCACLCLSLCVCVCCICVAHIGRRLSLNAWKMINRFIKVQCESKKKKKKILLLGRFVLRSSVVRRISCSLTVLLGVVFMSHCAYKYTTHTWRHLSLDLWWHVL